MKPTTNFEIITPDIALKMLEKNVGNRPVSQKNLDQIIFDMNRGNFLTTGEPIQFAKNGNLLNGQHRLLGIVKSNKSFEMLVIRGLDNDAFKVIDTGRNRKAADVLAIEGFANSSKMAAMASFIVYFTRGKYYQIGKGASKNVVKLTNVDISEFVRKNIQALSESMLYGYTKKNKVVTPTMLASLHFIFDKIDEKQADDFCHRLGSGTDLKEGTPLFLLHNKLLGDIRSVKKMPILLKTALICKAWNLYRKNEKVAQLKWDSVREPFPKPI